MESKYLKKRFLLFNNISSKLDYICSYDEKKFDQIEVLLDSYVNDYKEPDCCLIKKFNLIKTEIKESMQKHK